MHSTVNTMLMPKWWQMLSVLILRFCQGLFLVPFLLLFSGNVGVPAAIGYFVGIVAVQYVVVASIKAIEVQATKQKVADLEAAQENKTNDEGDIS